MHGMGACTYIAIVFMHGVIVAIAINNCKSHMHHIQLSYTAISMNSIVGVGAI